MKAALRKTYATHGPRRAKRLARRYMHSYSARVAVTTKSYLRDGWQLSDGDGREWLDLFADAQKVNAWRGPDERGVAFPIERTNGRPRYVYAFGTIHYACAWLAKDVLEVLGETCPTQFMSNGGQPKLQLWLEKELPKAELVVTTDIPSCFEMLLREALEDGLPLPRRVTKETMYEPKDRTVFLTQAPSGLVPMPKELVATVSSLKRGIPQGSAPASTASEIGIGSIIKAVNAVAPSVHAGSYGDNLIVLLEDEGKLKSVCHALTTTVAALCGSDVISELTGRTKLSDPRDGFNFCGLRYSLSKGSLRTTLPNGFADRFAIRTLTRIQDAQVSKDPKEIEKIRRSIVGWARQYCHIPGVLEEAFGLYACFLKTKGLG